jgi:rubredoxin
MKYECPCCGNITFDEKPPGTYDICPVCFWEDDPVQFLNPDYIGGANKVSLKQAKINYLKFGASSEEFINKVRPPTRSEKKLNSGH